MIWIALLFLGGLGALAVFSKRPVTETDVDRVTAHALIAERSTAVLRKLQYALSYAGRLAQANAVMLRANAIDAENAIEGARLREASTQVTGPVITATQVDPRAQRALEWSRMYGITIEEAYRRMAERGL